MNHRNIDSSSLVYRGHLRITYCLEEGKGVDDFVIYRYINFEGDGGILSSRYVTADT